MRQRDKKETRAIILAGIAGAGKSTVGSLLATELGWRFFDTDALHPQSNIEKMRRGVALEDEDRWPWLERVHKEISTALADGGTGVFECSVLKQAYRDYFLKGLTDTQVVLLAVDKETARARVAARSGHFFPMTLVDSQFEILESLQSAVCVDGSMNPEAIVKVIREELRLPRSGESRKAPE